MAFFVLFLLQMQGIEMLTSLGARIHRLAGCERCVVSSRIKALRRESARARVLLEEKKIR